MGTEGLNRYNGNSFTIYKNLHQKGGTDVYWTMYEDREGILWIGTCYYGLVKFNPSTSKFDQYSSIFKENAEEGKSVRGIWQDENATFWVGTTSGLKIFASKAGKFTDYLNKKDSLLTKAEIKCFYGQDKNTLWIGSALQGIFKLDATTQSFTHYPIDTTYQDKHANTVESLFQDDNGNVWVGSLRGLYKFDPKKEKFTLYPVEYTTDQITITSIAENDKESIWLATNNGIYDVNTENGKFTRYTHKPDNKEGIASPCVYYAYKDRAGVVWFANGEALSRPNLLK